MEIVETYPPNYSRIRQFIKPPQNAIFAYGNKIYNPHKVDIWPDLEEHEKVHQKQQGSDPEFWWEKYLQNKDFRLEQEIEAYGAQYQYLKGIFNNKGLKVVLFEMANALSKDYGLSLTYQEAENLIRNYGR